MSNESKTCTSCRKNLPEDAFPKCGHEERRRGVCTPCYNAQRRRGTNPLPEPQIDEGMASFGTPMQRVCAEEFLKAGSVAEAAVALDMTPATLRAHLDELTRKAAGRGYSPGSDMTKVAPLGFSVKGVSTLYDSEGNISGQWVKTAKDQGDDSLAKVLDALSAVADVWKGKAEPIQAPDTVLQDDILAVYVMGDPHIGLFAWADETGNNHDLKMGSEDLFTAVDHLVHVAPAAKNALVVTVGDTFHADSKNNTTTGGTPVDTDTRWPKVLKTGVRTFRRLIDRALEKHEHVTVVCSLGNHDWHSSIMLSICLAQFYENEPRVTVDTSPAKFHKFRFGKNLIGITHGDTTKIADLGEVMAVDWPADWGETDYRFWLTGHIHHKTVTELRGCVVESFRTLAPSDAWHKGKGYRSGQDMNCLVFHKDWGQINRHSVGINQIRARSGK